MWNAPYAVFLYIYLFQVDEAVAVLQAHQAKEAAQKSTTPAGVPSV